VKYELTSFDLWGNLKDGFECNDSYSQGIFDGNELLEHVKNTFEGFPLALNDGCGRHSKRYLHIDHPGNSNTRYVPRSKVNLDWSDDTYADVVDKTTGTVIGSVTAIDND
jgi:hypothetical protein